MLMIRLQRTGRKNEPFFKVVLTDSKNSTKSGKFIDTLGFYDPKAGKFEFKKDEILRRIKDGARLSDTVHNFLVREGAVEGKKKNVLSRKSPTQKRKELKNK